MKKTMILTLSILGMVLGSLMQIQPVKASGGCEYFGDRWNCSHALCGDCHAYQCPGGSTIINCAEI
jgi:hypothetical protein